MKKDPHRVGDNLKARPKGLLAGRQPVFTFKAYVYEAQTYVYVDGTALIHNHARLDLLCTSHE